MDLTELAVRTKELLGNYEPYPASARLFLTSSHPIKAVSTIATPAT